MKTKKPAAPHHGFRPNAEDSKRIEVIKKAIAMPGIDAGLTDVIKYSLAVAAETVSKKKGGKPTE